MRNIKKPEERRNEILDASEMLFASQGYTQTTINDILSAIGIAKGTFYYYFKSKEEVMDAIIDRFITSGVEAAQVVASNPTLTAPEKIFHIVMAQNMSDTPRKEQMIEQLHQINNAEMHQKSLIETITRLTPVLTAVVEEGIREGAFATPYPQESVEFLLVSSQFLFDEGLFHWQPEELLKKAQAFVYVMETILGAAQGTFHFITQLLSGSGGNV
ncbi:TetR/AcrR family transcriptional regulator [Paenibacillus sp. PR3]|uniref:TetR/AcrR family transcriptional regulator n=1 Tax=Paenibacillus terricola TaxID=2763503 RepID=A0ABR8MX57_9BACL|nr:TetR/AcrR family transcriptional regulator [Paenibacillus terricola]MBD3920517.1 TetR/AcrR family transcriptional regulator [Paenibacillus terricola]